MIEGCKDVATGSTGVLMGLPNILITNGYTWHNKGDAAIVLGMVRAIRHHVPDAQITLLSFTPETDQIHYAKLGVQVFTNFLNPYPALSSKLRTLLLRGPELGMRLVSGLVGKDLTARGALRDTLQAYKDASLVVGCGGGYLGGRKLQSLLHLYGLWLGKRFRKPTLLFAHSVEPFQSTLLAAATKYVLNHLEVVMCRENTTLQYLQSLRLQAPLALVPDAAFLVEPVPRKEAISLLEYYGVPFGGRPLVGITTRTWDFHEARGGNARRDKYKAALAFLTCRVVEKIDGEVIFFPQVTFGPLDDDRVASRVVCDSLPLHVRQRVHLIEDSLDVQEIKGMVGCMDLFVGTRMHSNIFALSQRVPCVAIAYENKTRGIMEMLGMREYVVGIGQVNGPDLWSMVQLAWQRRDELGALLNRSLPQVEEQALAGGALIGGLLESKAHRTLPRVDQS